MFSIYNFIKFCHFSYLYFVDHSQILVPTFTFFVNSGLPIHTNTCSCLGYDDDDFKSKQHVRIWVHHFLPSQIYFSTCSFICLFIYSVFVVFIEYFLSVAFCCWVYTDEDGRQCLFSEGLYTELTDMHAHKLAEKYEMAW